MSAMESGMDQEEWRAKQLNELGEAYAASLSRSDDENEVRSDIREKVDKLGISPQGFQDGIRRLRRMSAGERADYQAGIDATVGALGNRQRELFPEDFEAIRKREDAKRAEAEAAAAEARSQTELDEVTNKNPRSNPDAGGAGKKAQAAKGKTTANKKAPPAGKKKPATKGGDNVVPLKPKGPAETMRDSVAASDQMLAEQIAKREQGEQAEGDKVLGEMAPSIADNGAPKSQSQIAQEKRDAAKLN